MVNGRGSAELSHCRARLSVRGTAMGPGPVFLGYAVMGLIAFAFVTALVTETKGRSLEEIEADLQEETGGGGGRFTRRGRAAADREGASRPE